MFTCPWPAVAAGHVEAGAVVLDGELQDTVGLDQADRHGRVGRVLGGVLQRLQAAEVHRRLHLRGVPADAVGGDAHAEGTPVGGGAQRVGQAGVHEERWVDAVGQVAELLDGVLHGLAERVEHLGGGFGVVGEDVLGEAEVHRQRHQVLLGAVVEVALDLAPLGVSGRDDAGPRGAQVLVGALQVLEALLQRRVELDVVEREPDLAGELGEDPVVLVGEVVAVGGPLDHQQAEQLAGVRRRRDAELRRRSVLEEGGEPHLEPGVAGDTGTGHDRLLLGAEVQGRARCGRAPTPPARASRACRSRSPPGGARAPCGATRPAGAAARPWGWIG